MTKFKNTLGLLLTNALLVACLYYGVYKGITGFMNFLSFIIWFTFIVCVLTFWIDESVIVHYNHVKSRINFGILEKLFDILCVAVLVYFGHFLLGSIFTITLSLQEYMIHKGKELTNKN